MVVAWFLVLELMEFRPWLDLGGCFVGGGELLEGQCLFVRQ